MSIRLQNYLLILGLSLAISGILVYFTLSFVVEQKEDNVKTLMRAQIVSFAALLDQLDVESFKDPESVQKINEDYQRIIDRLTHNREHLEFYLLTPDATQIIWSARGTHLDVTWNPAQAKWILQRVVEDKVWIQQEDGFFEQTAPQHQYIAFAPVYKNNLKEENEIKAILACQIDASSGLGLDKEIYYSLIIVSIAALLLSVILAELITGLILRQIDKLDKQIQETIEHPGKHNFEPGTILETNALGDALQTLGSLLLDTLQKTKRTAIEGNVLGTDDRLSMAYRKHFSSPTHFEFSNLSIHVRTIGSPPPPWFAGAIENNGTITYACGVCGGSSAILDENIRANTCKYRALAALQNKGADLEAIIHKLEADYELKYFLAITIDKNKQSLNIERWQHHPKQLKHSQHDSLNESELISLTFNEENQDFTTVYLSNFQEDTLGQAAEELASILKDSAGDILTLIKFGSNSPQFATTLGDHSQS